MVRFDAGVDDRDGLGGPEHCRCGCSGAEEQSEALSVEEKFSAETFIFGSFQLHTAFFSQCGDSFQVTVEYVSAENISLAVLLPTAYTAVVEHIDELIQLFSLDVYFQTSFHFHGGSSFL